MNARGPAKRAGFPRVVRLLRHSDFERVYREGKRNFTAHMTVFHLARAGGASLRIGFTVPRALGGAVERNRMKRRLREAVRLHGLEMGRAVDVVINPKKSLLRADFSELQSEINRVFAVIGGAGAR